MIAKGRLPVISIIASRPGAKYRDAFSRLPSFLITLWLLAVCAGCGPFYINTGYPEVALNPVGKLTPIATIGIARVEDRRTERVAGKVGATNLLVGPELLDYIERVYRNDLSARGIATVEALDPVKNGITSNRKTLVVTLQSASVGGGVTVFSTMDASADIVVQVYAAGTPKVIFEGEFSGTNHDTIGLNPMTGVRSGSILAVAVDNAINDSFNNPAFLQALR